MTEDIAARLQEQMESLEDIIQKVRNDELTDIEALDTGIKSVCDYIDNMDPDAARKLETPIAHTIARLEDLIRELEHFKQRHAPKDAPEDNQRDNHGTH